MGTKIRRLSFLLSFPCLTFSYTFCPYSHHPGWPPTFCYRFQPASLAPFLFTNFRFDLSTFGLIQPHSRKFVTPLNYVTRQQYTLWGPPYLSLQVFRTSIYFRPWWSITISWPKSCTLTQITTLLITVTDQVHAFQKWALVTKEKMASPLDHDPKFPHYWSEHPRDKVFGANQCLLLPILWVLHLPSHLPWKHHALSNKTHHLLCCCQHRGNIHIYAPPFLE